MDDQSLKDHDSVNAEVGSIRERSFSQAGSDLDTRSQCSQRESDTRSQCSHRSDLGYHSAGASSDVGSASAHHTYETSSGGGGYHPLSSMRSVGSSGSQEDRGYHPPVHARVAAAHLMGGETQFPPSMYHAAAIDAPKSDVATVCSGSIIEDIEEESLLSCDLGGQASLQAPGSGSNPKLTGAGCSPPSSVKMAVGTLRRTNSAGNRLVDFADRSQELLSSVIPQERTSAGNASFGGLSHHESLGRLREMGPPLSRSLLLQGGSASRPGSVKSFASNAGSDIVSHVDTDDLGGSLRESVSDAHSVLSQEDAPMTGVAAAATMPRASASEDAKMAAVDTKIPAVAFKASETTAMDTRTLGGGTADDDYDEVSPSDKPHPLLCAQSDSLNGGRTSPGGTIYRGRGVRRYQGRFMHLPLQRFHQNAVHLRSVEEQHGGGAAEEGCYTDRSSELHDDYDGDRWQSRYDDESWERGRSSPRGNGIRRNSFQRLRSRSRSRSRSQEKDSSTTANDTYDNRRGSGGGSNSDHRGVNSGGGDRNGYRGRGSGGRERKSHRHHNDEEQHNGYKNRNGYTNNNGGRYPNGDSRNRPNNNRPRNNGGRGDRYHLDDDSSSNHRNGIRNNHRNRRK